MSARFDEAREKLRAESLAALPKWYSPIGHFVFLTLVGLAAVVLSGRNVHRPAALEWLAVPLAFIVANGFEWAIHKWWMHRARWPRWLYRSHTLRHHKIYDAHDMALKDRREIAFILLSMPTLTVIAAASVGFAYMVRALIGPNVAWLFFSTEMLYIIFAEAMHAAYHLPTSHRIRRFFWVRWLAQPHVLHHDMRLMRRWNFNIGIPFWDALLGSFTRRRYPEERKPAP